MQPDLQQLKITEPELEVLSGLDVGEVFVGGAIGGVYRPSSLQNRKHLISFLLTEIGVALLVFVFSLPIGLWLTHDSANGIQTLPAMLQFLQITLAITLVVIVGWNIIRWRSLKRLKPLMRLLDQVDRFHQVIQSVQLLDQLEKVSNRAIELGDRHQVLAALQMTRNNLAAGLMTERILREQKGLITRRYDLLDTIETNLTTLEVLEVSDQAQEYASLLNEAFQIGLSVQQEVQKLR